MTSLECPVCQEEMGKDMKVHLKLETTSGPDLHKELDICATQKWVCPGCSTKVEVPSHYGYLLGDAIEREEEEDAKL